MGTPAINQKARLFNISIIYETEYQYILLLLIAYVLYH